MRNKPIRPALAAARIWAVVIPLFYFLLEYLYELNSGVIAQFHRKELPDYLDIYGIVLLASAFWAIVPFLITWAMLAFWNKKRLSAAMMAERLLLLTLLFTSIMGSGGSPSSSHTRSYSGSIRS